MNVLVVSSIPWSRSNRGIDILTSYFIEKQYNVTHIVFPNYIGFKKKWQKFNLKSYPSNFKQIFSSETIFVYSYRFMKKFPKFFKKYIIKKNILSVIKVVDFKNYDIILIESGKPVILNDILPDGKFIIYRQSDPMVFLNEKDKELIKHERQMFTKSNLILTVRETFNDMLPEEVKNKSKIWLNGYDIPKEIYPIINPYKDKRKNAVYLGYSRLDFSTLKILSKDHPDVDFHIIGECLNKRDRLILLKNYRNIVFHGNLTSNEYLPYIKFANFAIVPYLNSKFNKYLGLTSKFLLFMYYGLPIVSYRTLLLNESIIDSILFANNQEDFSNKVLLAKNMQHLQYDINFKYFSSEIRKEELDNIFNKYF